MITPSKDKNLVSTGPCDCGSDRHHVRLGSRIRKSYELHCRRESLTDQFGKLFLIDIIPAKAPSSRESLIDRSTDGSIIMSVDTGSIFAEKVNVGVAIKGGEGASTARSKGYGKGVGMEDSPGVSTRLVLAG